VDAVEIAGVILQGIGEMLFERGRAGQSGGIEPSRHRDDHYRAEQHRAE
jgi:hypothetical protein